MKLIGQWLKNERSGTLNNASPLSPLVPVTKGNVITTEVGPSVVPKQHPLIDVEEVEIVASNPLQL